MCRRAGCGRRSWGRSGRRRFCAGASSPAEPPNGVERLKTRGLVVERALDEAVQSGDPPCAAEGDELDGPRITRLEAHRGTSRNIQQHAVCTRTIEVER